jgi:hypothetical protein
MARNFSFLLSQVRTATAALIGGKAYFYETGTSTLKKIWLDSEQNSEAANPYTLDANGTAKLYGSGIYRVVIKNSAGITKFDWDDILPGDNTSYDVTGFGAVGNGVADDTIAIQAALDATEALGGGNVYFPEGTYLASVIKIPTKVTVRGDGIGATILKQKDNTSGDFITLKSGSAVNVGLFDFSVDGNKANQSTANYGVKLDNSSGGSGLIPRHRAENLYITNCKGTGFSLYVYTKGSFVNNVDCYSNDVYGFELSGADSAVSNCVAGQSGSEGFRISGSSAIYSNLRSWYSGRLVSGSPGFIFRNSQDIIATGLYSQENSGHGFSLYGQSGPLNGISISCISDSDNASGGTYSGMALANVTGANIILKVVKFSGSIGTAYNGLSILGDSFGSNITVSVNDGAITGQPVIDNNGSNNVTINGDENFYTILKDDFVGASLSNQWTARKGSDGDCIVPSFNSQISGVARLTTGASATGDFATNGSSLTSGAMWAAGMYNFVAEFRVKLNRITDVSLFVGLTNTVGTGALSNTEMPFTLASGNALTSNVSNAVGVLFDTAADTDNWWLVGVDDGVDAAKQDSLVAPTMSTFEYWKITITNTGVATFFRKTTGDYAIIGTSMIDSVKLYEKLSPVVCGFSRSAASTSFDVDFIRCSQLRG